MTTSYLECRPSNLYALPALPIVKRPTGAGGEVADGGCVVAAQVTPPQLPWVRATSHAHTSAVSISGRLAMRRAVRHVSTCPYLVRDEQGENYSRRDIRQDARPHGTLIAQDGEGRGRAAICSPQLAGMMAMTSVCNHAQFFPPRGKRLLDRPGSSASSPGTRKSRIACRGARGGAPS